MQNKTNSKAKKYTVKLKNVAIKDMLIICLYRNFRYYSCNCVIHWCMHDSHAMCKCMLIYIQRQLGDRMHYELMVLTSTLHIKAVSKNECAAFKDRDQFRYLAKKKRKTTTNIIQTIQNIRT